LEKDNTADQYGEDYHVGFYPGGSSLQRRYTFNTSDYVFGTLKVVPRANMDASGYQNSSNRWMGVTFASSSDARIAVFGRGTSGGRGYAEIIGDAKHNAMVVARDPSASQSDATLIFVSKSVWDTNVVQGDWLFLRSGNGYAAIRVASSAPSLPSYDVTDTPELLGKFLTLREMWSPIVIQMGQASDPHYDRLSNLGSFEEFRQSVTSNYFNYANGVLTYRSEVCDAGLSSACEEYVIRSGATYVTNIAGYPLPTVNGGGSVSPAKTYSSPFINGEHGKDTVVLSHEDHAAKELNFAWQ
jgi:hypothetical protein